LTTGHSNDGIWRYAPLVVHATQEEEEGHSDAQHWASECPGVKNYNDGLTRSGTGCFSGHQRVKQRSHVAAVKVVQGHQQLLQLVILNLSLDEAITVAQNRPLCRLSAFGAMHP